MTGGLSAHQFHAELPEVCAGFFLPRHPPVLVKPRERILLFDADQASLPVLETLVLDMLVTDNPPNEDDSGR